jgi:hypothetical protein
MNWLVWRQHRHQAVFAAAALGAFAVLLIVTGIHMASLYRSALRTCAATDSCNHLDLFHGGYQAVIDTVNLSAVVPVLLGLFWGAPLIAREIEQDTHKLAWTQTVTRQRWFTAKVGWVIGAAALWGAGISALVTWWSNPENALQANRFDPSPFGTQGLVPVAYALFAVALGIAAGALLRRTLPALAATGGLYVAVRLVVTVFVRPHYQAPVIASFPLDALPGAAPPLIFPGSSTPSSAWVYSVKFVDAHGHAIAGGARNLRALPDACRVLEGQEKFPSCLSSHGFHWLVTYQPAARYWRFQGIEAAIFVGLAAALLALAFVFVTRRDA